MVSHMRKKKSYFLVILRNSKEYFLKARYWGALEQFIAIFRALLFALEMIATKRLFDDVISAVDYLTVVTSLLLLMFVIILQQLLSGLSQYLFSKVSYTNMGKFMVEFQKKLGRFPAIYFENPEFLDKIEKAKECLEYESLGHFASICLQMVTHYLIYLLTVGGYLFVSSPYLAGVVILSFVPAMMGQVLKTKYFVDLEELLAPERRRCNAYKKSIVNVSSYKETRMLGAYHYFYKLFLESLLIMVEKRWEAEKKLAYIQTILNGFTFLGIGISIYILFTQMISGSISVGMFASVFVILSDVFAIMDELISIHLSEGSEILGHVANFYELMDLDEMLDNSEIPDFGKGIEARGISYTYPGQIKDALSNITLYIKPGETIAVVGENGSGKSTLVNVLMGIYAPYSGELIIGGQMHDTKSLRQNYCGISGVFQNFQRYKLTVQENVSISNLCEKENIERIEYFLKEARFDYPSSMMETVLSPEFGGVDLSGGQWQRLAIARGLFRPNEFIVLDEPTAAIDPIEESNLYKQFKEIISDRCAVIVTHRLGSTKFASRIIVMDEGRIVEMGSHEQLMKKRGKYYSMWEAQSAWYCDECNINESL